MVVPRILNTFSSISGYVNCREFLPMSSSDRRTSKVRISQALMQLVMNAPALVNMAFYCFQSLRRHECFQRSIQFWTHSCIHLKAWSHTASRMDTAVSMNKPCLLKPCRSRHHNTCFNFARPCVGAGTNIHVATALWETDFAAFTLGRLRCTWKSVLRCQREFSTLPSLSTKRVSFQRPRAAEIKASLASWATPGIQRMNKLTP